MLIAGLLSILAPAIAVDEAAAKEPKSRLAYHVKVWGRATASAKADGALQCHHPDGGSRGLSSGSWSKGFYAPRRLRMRVWRLPGGRRDYAAAVWLTTTFKEGLTETWTELVYDSRDNCSHISDNCGRYREVRGRAHYQLLTRGKRLRMSFAGDNFPAKTIRHCAPQSVAFDPDSGLPDRALKVKGSVPISRLRRGKAFTKRLSKGYEIREEESRNPGTNWTGKYQWTVYFKFTPAGRRR